jgi:hypothetical protein
MSRIPELEMERLKQEVSIQRLVESIGVTLKRHGADLIGLCPFHDDHAPSLVISPTKNLWHCLGACQAGGSVIDWVMRAEGVSFRHGVELLQADYAVQGCTNAAGGRKPGATQPLAAVQGSTNVAGAGSTRATAGPVKRSTVQKLPTVLAPDAEDAKLLRQVVDYFTTRP